MSCQDPAVDPLEPLARKPSGHASAADLAWDRFGLAQASWAMGKERRRARHAAALVRDFFGAATDDRTAMERWPRSR